MPDDGETVTVSRVEVEAVEEERAVCSNCEQLVEPDEAVTVGIDVRKDSPGFAAEDSSALCPWCAESFFGYERPENEHRYVETAAEWVTERESEIPHAIGILLASSVALSLALGAIALVVTSLPHLIATESGNISPGAVIIGGMVVVILMTELGDT